MPTHYSQQRVDVSADEPISVTVDASELSAASAEPLRNIISRYGRPVVARAFADFQQPNLSDLAVQLYQMGITLVHCPTWPNGDGSPKPLVADVLAQDLRDQLEEVEDVETFLLVATSRDYIAVANALKRHDRRVVVVAEEAKVCRELRLCADEFAILPPARPERSESRSRRSAEPAHVERPAEASRPEPQEAVRLPTDAEVLAEVRRVVAAEGICTPRRLARALCPVDRTPTGELRSRIANRIQALIDSGKLLRERLVVGGTAVETILARDERAGTGGHQAMPEVASAPAPHLAPSIHAREADSSIPFEAIGGDGMVQGEPVPDVVADSGDGEREMDEGLQTRDLDALVESVLRAPELAASFLNRPAEPGAEAAAQVEQVVAPAERPKRSRARRRTPAKTAATEAE